MFRSKKKKVGGRKRREVEAEGDDEVATGSGDVGASSAAEIPTSDAPESTENDLQVLEKLRRNRSRSVKSSMTFSSKANGGGSGHAATASRTGLLSFDDGEGKSKQKKRKMRPNLVASSAVDVEMETETTGQYSAEMLASLRSEQSVLLSGNSGEKDQEAPVRQENMEMEEVVQVENGNDEGVKKIVVEKEEEGEEEEFISLDAGEKKTRKRKNNRVTFGVRSEGLGISKTAEVVEEVSSGEGESDEQNRRWEEELMRRGGHRVPPPTQTNSTRSRDDLPSYPTKRKVVCVSLGSVLGKLEKSLESTSFEDERASRERARLEAETALIETTLKQQQQELLASSEEFEYFQDVEDFVKGLSFCLREKVSVIKAKEKKVIDDRVQRMETKQQEEHHGVVEEVKHYLGSGILQHDEVFGLKQLDLHSNGDSTAVSSTNDIQRAARVRKYQQHFTESYVADPHHEDDDLFADAIDEINSLERVYRRFQEWKAKFPHVYENAYCELAQEKLFAPFVQAELLYWDPLAVADVKTELGKSWSLGDFAWFRVLHQHLRQPGNDGENDGAPDGPTLYQIRDVLLEKVRVALSSYFDPYSSLQTRSLSLMLEEINRHGYTPHVEGAVHSFITTALETFSREAKRTVLVAIDQNATASSDDVKVFARYLVEKFNALQDNLLTLFVILPQGSIAASGFRCLLQLLHQLLAYIRHCQEIRKMELVAVATQIVRQLSGSSYLLQILSEPSQERELKRTMELFEPFLRNTAQ